MGDTAFTRKFSPGRKWIPANVMAKCGILCHCVEVESSGLIYGRWHLDQLRSRYYDKPNEGVVDNAADSVLPSDIPSVQSETQELMNLSQ